MSSRCRQSGNIQDYLDREVAPSQAQAFAAHLSGCPSCTREIEVYRRMFAVLDLSIGEVARLDPGPSLTEQILDRVLPSRLRRRLVTVIGWIYGASASVATFAAVSWLTRPETPVWLAQRYSEISLRAMQSLLFSFQVVTRSWFELLQGWDLMGRFVGLLSPLARALARPLADPTVGLITAAAMLACVLVLWWMRPRPHEAREGVRHVGVLGF